METIVADKMFDEFIQTKSEALKLLETQMMTPDDDCDDCDDYDC
jgi:hypothetical protein